MKRNTNLWDFACEHPLLFILGVAVVAKATSTIIVSVLNKDDEKENNQDGIQTDNVQSSASV